jgi:predicted amidophosphoribosyltransferase
MALLDCPNCEKKISETTNACPHCGYKLPSDTPGEQVSNVFSKLVLVIGETAILAVYIFLHFKWQLKNTLMNIACLNILGICWYYGWKAIFVKR